MNLTTIVKILKALAPLGGVDAAKVAIVLEIIHLIAEDTVVATEEEKDGKV
jgi:hypothetical protein